MEPRRQFIRLMLALPLVPLAGRTAAPSARGAIVVDHLPATYARRAGELTANVCGRLPADAPLRFRLNEGPWRSWQAPAPASPRTPPGSFTLELEAAWLRPGRNLIRLESAGAAAVERVFDYDPAPPALPRVMRWDDDARLDVQDGRWECRDAGRERVARPVPGTEDYDRLLLACGSFAGAREVECEVTFRHAPIPGRPFGFGLLPLWAGHVEDTDTRPRRGWRFGIAWYYSNWNGFGVEASEKVGAARPRSVDRRAPTSLEPGSTWRLTSAARPEPAGWKLTIEATPADPARPALKAELDAPADLLPTNEPYAVALVAHRAQVEFGPVRVADFAA